MPSKTIYQEYHYVYQITNLADGRRYIGVRTSKNVLPQYDIGIKYFSSSLDENFIKDQKENPSLFKYEVLSTFKTREEANEYEIELHKNLDVAADPNFYNRVNSPNNFLSLGMVTVKDKDGKTSCVSVDDPRYLSGELVFYRTGEKHSEEAIRKMSECKLGDKNPMFGIRGENNPLFGKPRNEEFCKKMSECKLGDKHPMFGKSHKEETIRKMSEAQSGEKNYMFGKKHTEERKKQISEKLKGRQPSEKNRKKTSELKKGTIWITNGIENRQVDPSEQIPEGFRHGLTSNKPRRKGMKRSEETKEKMRGQICITDGEINTRIKPSEQIPEGFIRGVTRRKII